MGKTKISERSTAAVFACREIKRHEIQSKSETNPGLIGCAFQGLFIINAHRQVLQQSSEARVAIGENRHRNIGPQFNLMFLRCKTIAVLCLKQAHGADSDKDLMTAVVRIIVTNITYQHMKIEVEGRNGFAVIKTKSLLQSGCVRTQKKINLFLCLEWFEYLRLYRTGHQ